MCKTCSSHTLTGTLSPSLLTYLLPSPSILQAMQDERKEMKKIVLDFEQRQEEEEYQGECTRQRLPSVYLSTFFLSNWNSARAPPTGLSSSH